MMKFMQKNDTTKGIDNSAEVNNNKNVNQYDNRADAENVMSPSNSSYSNHSNQSSSHVKTPTHFHHPDYVRESARTDNASSSIDGDSRRVMVNVHPESGVDHSSILEPSHSARETPSPARSDYRRSWYSRWEDKIDEEEIERSDKVKEEKSRRNTEELMKLPCRLGKMVLVEQEKIDLDRERQELDPRWASRSPNAANPVLTKPRYQSPINASPSRTLRDAREQAQSVQCLTTQKDDHVNNNENRIERGEVHADNGTFILVNEERSIPKGRSMPEIAGNVKLFPYHILSTRNQKLPKGVDRTRLEQHLTYKEFHQIFEMSRDEFWKLPKWKRMEMKKKVNLF